MVFKPLHNSESELGILLESASTEDGRYLGYIVRTEDSQLRWYSQAVTPMLPKHLREIVARMRVLEASTR